VPVLVSIASGKGGVGKSVTACNLGVMLARLGQRVVLADLDVGGADLHLMLGSFAAERRLSDFLARRVESLSDVLTPVGFCRGLQLLPGTGESLDSANPRPATKQRLVRALKRLDADIVLMDIGAGANFHTLDFFLAGDLRVLVATPEPASVVDAYTFIKLAAVRAIQLAVGSRAPAVAELVRADTKSLAAIIETVGAADPSAREAAEVVLASFRPLLVQNRVAPGARINLVRLNETLRQYVGSTVELLGEIPEDAAVGRAIRTFGPVADSEPDSPAGRAYLETARRLFAGVRSAAAGPAIPPRVEPAERPAQSASSSSTNA
jgi:flagellar biosynthesis protein FlhG